MFIKRLLKEWNKHGKIIIALDFDDTVFPFRMQSSVLTRVIDIVKEAKEIGAYVVINTASAFNRYAFIYEYCQSLGLVIEPKFNNTKPERFLQSILSVNGVEYETHKKLYGLPDIFIEPNTCVFVDGCYWHGCNKCGKIQKDIKIRKLKDNKVNKILNKKYKVIRLWEHEINNDLVKCLNKIHEVIN